MCGLVGVAGNLFQGDIKAFNELLYVDMLRGAHATGVASIKGRRSSTLKKAWTPGDLMLHKDYNSHVTASADVIIGHNRHGTIGNNSDHNNAHPFDFDRIVGAHNGTLDRQCVRNLHNHALYGTDSEALYSEINHNGIDQAFTKIEGAWALTFFDKADGTLNMVRNSQRPLHYAYKKGRSVLYWASEFDMLAFVLSRNNVELEDDEIFQVTTDELLTWNVGRNMGAPTKRELKSNYTPLYRNPNYKWDATISDFRLKTDAEKQAEAEKKTTAVTTSGGTSNVTPFHIAQQTPTTKTPTTDAESSLTGKSTTSGDTGSETSQVINAARFRRELVRKFGPPTYKDKRGHFIGKVRFDNVMDHSCCSYCGNDEIEFGDPVLFLESETSQGWSEFLCEACLANPNLEYLVPELTAANAK